MRVGSLVRLCSRHRSVSLACAGTAATAAVIASACSAPIAEARTRAQVAELSADVQRAWAALTNPETGAVTDVLPPGPHATRDYNYGTFLLADAQLRTAKRTGEGAPRRPRGGDHRGDDQAQPRPSSRRSVQPVRRRVADQPRSGRAVATRCLGSRAGHRVEAIVRRFRPFTGHGFRRSTGVRQLATGVGCGCHQARQERTSSANRARWPSIRLRFGLRWARIVNDLLPEERWPGGADPLWTRPGAV